MEHRTERQEEAKPETQRTGDKPQDCEPGAPNGVTDPFEVGPDEEPDPFEVGPEKPDPFEV